MPSRTQSILLGGLVVGLLGTSYLGLINLLCCAGVIIGSMVAVWHYTNENALTIPPGQGAAMGAAAAVIGALISWALNYLLTQIGMAGPEALIMGFMESFYPPEQVEQMRDMQSQGTSPVMMVVGLIIGVVVSAIFGAVGGAIGASVFKKGGPAPHESLDAGMG
jgi:hypothetical protein